MTIQLPHDPSAANTEYTDCYAISANRTFSNESHQVKRGRPKKDSASEAFEKLCSM